MNAVFVNQEHLTMISPNSRRQFIKGSAVGMAVAPHLWTQMGNYLETGIAEASPHSQASDLKITRVRSAYMRGHGTHLFIKIETNQGITGYGEGMDAVSGSVGLVQHMADRIKGKNPLDVNRLVEDVLRSGFFHGAQSGMYVAVLTAIEFALWDLAGKAVGLPIYRMLGGKFRDKIRIYCDTASSRESPEKMAELAREVQNHGFTAIKFDLDWVQDPNKYDPYNRTANNAEIDRMIGQMAAVREAIGPHMDLCADMHGRYDTTTGIRVAKALEPYRMMWLEEPIPAENLDAYREIREHTTTPICLGENHYLAHDFRKALEKKACDVVMPDLHKCGGIAEGQRIAYLAHLYYVPMAPHMVASPLGAMGACHCCAAVPNFLCCEWHWISRWEQWNNLIEEDPIIQDGYITVSDKPGIGVTLNQDAVKEFAVEGVPFFE